jgi:hypothetical protein
MASTPRRVGAFVRHRGLDAEAGQSLVDRCFQAVDATLVVVPEVAYQPLEEEARWRCARDPEDWPIVALALSLDLGVWTEDEDFLGTGVGQPARWTGGCLASPEPVPSGSPDISQRW